MWSRRVDSAQNAAAATARTLLQGNLNQMPRAEAGPDLTILRDRSSAPVLASGRALPWAKSEGDRTGRGGLERNHSVRNRAAAIVCCNRGPVYADRASRRPFFMKEARIRDPLVVLRDRLPAIEDATGGLPGQNRGRPRHEIDVEVTSLRSRPGLIAMK